MNFLDAKFRMPQFEADRVAISYDTCWIRYSFYLYEKIEARLPRMSDQSEPSIIKKSSVEHLLDDGLVVWGLS